VRSGRCRVGAAAGSFVLLVLVGVVEEDRDGGGGLGVFALWLEEAALELEDVVAQGVVLVLDDLVVVLEGVQLADLLFELLDVALFALTEGALLGGEGMVSERSG
jgi:hypothetical protein